MSRELDLSEFEQLSTRSKPRRCVLATAIQRLSREDQAKVLAATMADADRISVGGVAKWLGKRGIEISHQLVMVHRHRKCSCFRARP